MADNEKKLFEWENKIGMATVTGVMQVIILIVTIAVAFNSVKDAIDNSKVAVTELKNIVTTIQSANAANAERITRVEERTDSVVKSLDRIERKVDALTQGGQRK